MHSVSLLQSKEESYNNKLKTSLDTDLFTLNDQYYIELEEHNTKLNQIKNIKNSIKSKINKAETNSEFDKVCDYVKELKKLDEVADFKQRNLDEARSILDRFDYK